MATAGRDIQEIEMARLLTIKQVADKVGYCESKVYAMIRADEFPAGRKMSTGGTRWLESEVDAWIMRAYQQAPAARLHLA